MRLSWLEPGVIRMARAQLRPPADDWEALFERGFHVPPAPPGISRDEWPHVAEHVARAERVSQVVREHGLEAAVIAFRDSPHAVEIATVIAAAVEVDAVSYDLLRSLFACQIDDLIVYGTFLGLLIEHGENAAAVVDVYEQFCDACEAAHCTHPRWPERLAMMRDGLASLYVSCGRFDDGDALFRERHEEDPTSLTTALSASRSFLAAGEVGRSVLWLGLGAERARALGRADMASKLIEKAASLRRRMS